jgi:integrase
MTYAKMFIRWAWRKEILANLPRNLNELTIKIDPKRPETLDIENEVKPLLLGANGRTKLFLMLMLNTGMTQIDISELKPEEVNWEEGRIIRKRTKTQHNENVPIVNYKIWDEAFSLLKEYGHKEGERVILNKNGTPLVKIDMKEDGTRKRIDAIRLAYSRLCLRLKVPCRPLKLLRNTSATLLYNKEEYRDLYDILLDHAPKGIGQKHYADAGKGILDKALAYLGQQYGIR